MSLAWSARQREWLREMGFALLERREAGALTSASASQASGGADARDLDATADAAPGDGAGMGRVPAGLLRLARGVDLAPLLAAHPPRDAAGRRALWRALRPLRKAARAR